MFSFIRRMRGVCDQIFVSRTPDAKGTWWSEVEAAVGQLRVAWLLCGKVCWWHATLRVHQTVRVFPWIQSTLVDAWGMQVLWSPYSKVAKVPSIYSERWVPHMWLVDFVAYYTPVSAATNSMESTCHVEFILCLTTGKDFHTSSRIIKLLSQELQSHSWALIHGFRHRNRETEIDFNLISHIKKGRHKVTSDQLHIQHPQRRTIYADM